METFYILVLLVSMSREGAMTAIPGFSSRESCESAGAAFTKEAAKREYEPRFYCFVNNRRNGTR